MSRRTQHRNNLTKETHEMDTQTVAKLEAEHARRFESNLARPAITSDIHALIEQAAEAIRSGDLNARRAACSRLVTFQMTIEETDWVKARLSAVEQRSDIYLKVSLEGNFASLRLDLSGGPHTIVGALVEREVRKNPAALELIVGKGRTGARYQEDNGTFLVPLYELPTRWSPELFVATRKFIRRIHQ